MRKKKNAAYRPYMPFALSNAGSDMINLAIPMMFISEKSLKSPPPNKNVPTNAATIDTNPTKNVVLINPLLSLVLLSVFPLSAIFHPSFWA